MANPQAEYGYIRIANDIMEALAQIRIPGETRQIIDTVIRKTYGFNKKLDIISISQFSEATGLKKSNCCRAINKAIDMNIVIKNDNKKFITYQFNKDYDTWKPLSKKITALSKKITDDKKQEVIDKSLSKKITQGVIKKDNEPLSKKINTKDIKQKTKRKYIKEKFLKPTVAEIAEYCKERNNGINAQLFFDHYETSDWKRGNTAIKSWKACVRTWEQRNKTNSKEQTVSKTAYFCKDCKETHYREDIKYKQCLIKHNQRLKESR
jgi:phage replication O-like protein O